MSVMTSFSLQGKNALVTGGTRGIGYALAQALAQAGARVTITGRDAVTLKAAVAQLRASGVEAQGLILDVTQVESIQQTLAAAGRVDILINNAGTEQIRPSLEVDEALWDTIVGTNLKGAFFVLRRWRKTWFLRHPAVRSLMCAR
jgi:Short-chain alcohol dehydrogenase of unknown specificity